MALFVMMLAGLTFPVFLAIVITVVPVLIVYVLFQRRIAGSVSQRSTEVSVWSRS
ncbi:hypothetical protein G5C51_24100 [Streptomyces sp. A7024]|uniref:Uncharacterized protein n=1 Tax=Streptomyces coryli TaxID=1128680 RepID=A0A6G4U6Q4_9ACTN|nr:hypothetical protein [Streptomyces coryli]NGN66977.1 hypothetical protein [Streptomyces coryli]